jgi:hypothetical protein
VLVRPESIALGANGNAPDGTLSWSGRVKEMVFRGSHRSIQVETPSQILRVEAPSQYSVAVGEAVTLTASSSAAWAIEG